MFKNILLYAVLLLANSTYCYSQIDALFDYKTYYQPDTWKPYIETHLSVNGNSMKMAPISNTHAQGKLGVVLTFEKDNTIITFSKYDLSSPSFAHHETKTFYDLQRIEIDTGLLNLEMTLSDLNGDLMQVDTANIQLQVPDISKDSIHLVNLELIQSMTRDSSQSVLQKAGFEIIPKLLKYYPENEDVLRFYSECYFPQLSENETKPIVIRYYIKPEGRTTQMIGMNAPKRINTSKVLPIIGSINIAALPSGNYELRLEIINQAQQIIAATGTKIFRNNPKAMLTVVGDPNRLIKESFIGSINSYDTLKNYIDCLWPIAGADEKEVIEHTFSDANSNITKMQLFFYNFWYARNSLAPSESWVKYRTEVNRVNKSYGSNFRKGYDSDRGIVYLKYGPPNSATKESEPSAYPYEIWFYQKIGNVANKRFVFYNPTLIADDYVLLHSDMLGETRNPNWLTEIYRRAEGDAYGSPNTGGSHWGTRAQDIYNNPR
jgi:GWxTD domain-containing protein